MSKSRNRATPAPWLDEDIRLPPLEEEWRGEISELPVFRPDGDDDGLGWEEILAQESWALTQSGPLHGCRAALSRTLDRLRRGRMIYEKSEREGAKIQLEAVLAFFDLFRSLGILRGDMPLRALLRGLESLDRGAVEPMLQPAKQPAGGRPVSLQSVLVRGFAAAGVELARRAGRQLPEACEFVAEQLDALGYRVAAGRGDGRITGATVRAWRREALERVAPDPLCDMYEKLLASGYSFGSSRGIKGFFDELRAWAAPDGVENPPG